MRKSTQTVVTAQTERRSGPMTMDQGGFLNSRRGGLAERAYDHIKRMLITGEVTRRDWFPIDKIAGTLKTSRQPVMDALRRLSTEGFVDIVPQVGCRPRNPEISEIRDFYRLFAEGESIIAELAAERATSENILAFRLISSQISALANQLGELANIADTYRSLNRQLHSEIRRAARSPSLAEIVESLGDRSDFYIAFFRDKVFALNLKVAHAEHEEVIAAIVSGDPRKARSAMKKHIKATEKRLEENFVAD